MDNKQSYVEQSNIKNTLKLREIRKHLPMFCSEFFLGIENNTATLTRLAYAQDLSIFFKFLSKEVPEFCNTPITLLNITDLEKITSTIIEQFLDYLSYYVTDNNKCFKNKAYAKSRKLASIRSFLKYYFKKDEISKNVASKVDNPKINLKNIIRLDNDEVVRILDVAETGVNLTKMQKHYNQITTKRDTAILTLFLGTGIRISELIGININDIDFNENKFSITRKGGNQYILYFSNEVKTALLNYYVVRKDKIITKLEDKDAFFLSLKNQRINVRTVQNLVSKYSKIASPLKKISPHKLRSTYGTNLYKETHDIYIVADVLGHKDVNTTKKHYAAISEDIRKDAANKIKLRKTT